MTPTFKTLFFLLTLAVTIAACGKKAIVNKQLNDNFKVQETKFTYLLSRAKILYKDNNQEVSSAVDIRIKKDSVIWLSIKPMLGVEAMRIVITQDSVLILDKMQKSMNLLSMSDLSKKLNFPLSFKMAESLIIGNLPVEVKEKGKVAIEKEYFKLQQEENRFDLVSLISREHYKLEKINVKETETNSELILRYQDFKIVEAQLVPFTSTAILNYKSAKNGGKSGEMELNMYHTKLDFPKEPLTFPFQRLQLGK
jgi:hypothetical protein